MLCPSFCFIGFRSFLPLHLEAAIDGVNERAQRSSEGIPKEFLCKSQDKILIGIFRSKRHVQILDGVLLVATRAATWETGFRGHLRTVGRLNLKRTRDSQKESSFRKKSVFREYAEAAIMAVLLALFIRTFVVQAFKIPSGSMEPTLLVGDHILVNKFLYGVKIPFFRKTVIPVSEPQREDVVVFIYPVDKSKDFIKRVIGLPGDTVEIVGRRVYINGKLSQDKHAFYAESKEVEAQNLGPANRIGPITVPPGDFFVMGDNRDHSYDSRFWGFVPAEAIKGKAFIIYWSWPHWERFLHLIH